MASVSYVKALAFLPLIALPAFYFYSPASKNTKVFTLAWSSIAAAYLYFPYMVETFIFSVRNYVVANLIKTALIALVVLASLKYVQHTMRFARLNAIKMMFGFDDNPASYENMTIEQAQEVEANMAEWEFPRLWQFGWISDFFRTSTDPAVSRTISSSGHFINEDKRIEHQRMQATIHLMSGLAGYPIKSRNHSLVVSRINEHHHRYGIKINSDDVLYLVIHFGLAPVPWINKYGYRKLEAFEVHAIWTLWREIGCRMGVKHIPKTLEQATEWRRNFETTFRWREDANEKMATAMLDQVLYPVPGPFKWFVAHVFSSLIDYDIVHLCQLEKYKPSPITREVVGDILRSCGWIVRHFYFPRTSRYVRSPTESKEDGKMVFPHTPYDTMPWWQEASFWNLWGPRALIWRLRGLPVLSAEYQSEGVPFEAMGAPHPHARTQSAIEMKVRDSAAILEDAPYGIRPAIGFQANRLIGPVEGPNYGMDMNTFPEGRPTTPNSPLRFGREYERRAAKVAVIGAVEQGENGNKTHPRVDEKLDVLVT